MPIEKHNRLEMAKRQLGTALALFFEGNDYYSAITLAGAADEVFGQVLRAQGKEPRLEEIAKSVTAIYKKLYGSEITPKSVVERANHARNALKHWSESQPIVVMIRTKDPRPLTTTYSSRLARHSSCMTSVSYFSGTSV